MWKPRRSLRLARGQSALLLLLLCALQISPAHGRSRSKSAAKASADGASPASAAGSPASGPDPLSASPPPGAVAPSPAAGSDRATAENTASPRPVATPQPPLPKLGKGDIEAARAQASAHFQAGRYADAAEMLLRVFETEPQPLYLFNAGQAYRKGEKPREAKATYERFLEVAPTHKLAPEVRGYVKDMDALLLTQQKAQQISLELDREKAEADFARRALLQERSKPLYKQPVLWVLLGGGVLAVLTGLGVAGYFSAVSQSDLGTQPVVLP